MPTLVAARGPSPDSKTPGVVRIPLIELEVIGFLLLGAVLGLVGVALWSHHHRVKKEE